MVKNPPAMRETWVRSLAWEDPLEEGMAIHSSILAWEIPWTEEPGGCRTPPIPRSALEKDPRPGPLFEGNPVGEGTTRRGTATPVHRPQRPAQGRGSLMSCRLWGRTELDTTEAT